jgi:hypothetical protein
MTELSAVAVLFLMGITPGKRWGNCHGEWWFQKDRPLKSVLINVGINLKRTPRRIPVRGGGVCWKVAVRCAQEDEGQCEHCLLIVVPRGPYCSSPLHW